jgi:plastocyanin
MRAGRRKHSIWRLVVGLCAFAAAVTGFPLAVASAGPTAAAPTTTNVGMEGTFVYRPGLKFAPAKISVHVGDVVRWTNNSIVPHTATENHNLWKLAGNFGPPLSVGGVPPNGMVQRTFEAGTHLYFCEVHPVEMHGEIDVPVDLSVTSQRVRRHHHFVTIYTIHARWDATAPASGLVFDVERAQGSGSLKPWLTGTSSSGATFTTTKRGSVWHVRARLRRANDTAAATGFSPDAFVKAG